MFRHEPPPDVPEKPSAPKPAPKPVPIDDEPTPEPN